MRTRRPVAGLLAGLGLAAAGMAACDPGPVGAEPTTACGDEPSASAGAPGDAEILLRAGVFPPGGAPRYVVYADGAVFLVGLPEADAAGRPAGGHAAGGAVAAARPAPVGAMAPLPGSDAGTTVYAGALPGCALDRVVELAEDLAAAVVALDGDLGSPGITDHGSATLTYIPPGGEPVVASAYALGEEGPDGGVDREQLRARQLMVDLGAVVHANALRLEPIPVDRVVVEGAGGDPGDVDWPLETPITDAVPDGRCGIVEGDDARVLAEAVASGHDFLPDGGFLSIRALAPGEPACRGQ